MAPLRSQIMHLTETLKVRDRKMSYFYGARALIEAFYLEDFYRLEKEFPNTTSAQLTLEDFGALEGWANALPWKQERKK